MPPEAFPIFRLVVLSLNVLNESDPRVCDVESGHWVRSGPRWPNYIQEPQRRCLIVGNRNLCKMARGKKVSCKESLSFGQV